MSGIPLLCPPMMYRIFVTLSQAWKDTSVTKYIPFCKSKLENVTHEADHERLQKRQNDDLRRFRGAQRSHNWGSPNGWLIWFKCRTVRVYRGLSPGTNLWTIVCKRNYFVLQWEIANFACWRRCYVECFNVIKWTMLKGNYFVFDYVSLTMRAF